MSPKFSSKRLVPGPVKRAIKRIFRGSIRKNGEGDSALAAKSVNLQLIGAELRESTELPLSAVGKSYSPSQISNILQYEVAYLKKLYFDSLDATSSEPSSSSPDAEIQNRVAVYLGGFNDQSPVPKRHLVLLADYPRADNIYVNGFVHRRVKHYQDAGIEVHVAVIGENHDPHTYEYDGVRVIAGRGHEAAVLLREVDYESVSVHFLTEYIWDRISPHLKSQRLYCFVHGFEARRWIWTMHNQRSITALEDEIAISLRRQHFWRRVLDHKHGPAKFIFVSEWWHDTVQDDLELVFPNSRTKVIHNLIDTRLFNYVEKPEGQRFRILWVRSANNLNYGSDIAVAVLQRLKESPYWRQLQIKIVGDGRFFGQFQKHFGDDENVAIEQGFIEQNRIAELHKSYGLFLVPTRLDTQGVSRDEAMSSGLVPITNRVAAVPEFVDDTCAVVADSEDVDGMVEGIKRLLENPRAFAAMSKAAAARVREQSGPSATVQKELELMGLSSTIEGQDV